MVTAAVSRLQPDHALEAAGYIRVSRKVQAEGHSPEIQRESIKRLAQQEGYILTDDRIREDHERGSKVTREGYRQIIEWVRQGIVHVVLVYMHDRWGRDGAEWLARAREFDRLGVPIISVQEGRDEGGLMRFVRAGMAQWYSEQLASRVVPAREKAAREGIHTGPTPLGYKRVYPPWDGKGRRPPARLVPDEAMAWVIQEMFSRYASGGWSTFTLADWANSDPRVPPPAKSARWTSGTIGKLLKRAVYMGYVEHNKRPQGTYLRAPEGSTFMAPGRHEALVSEEMWHEVQRRMKAAHHWPSHNRRTFTTKLATGLLRCEVCGATLSVDHGNHGRKGQYICVARTKRRLACTSSAYNIDVAHTALLAEVRRLQGTPWDVDADQRLPGADDVQETETAAWIRRALDQEQERMRRHARRMLDLEDDPTPAEITAFREIGREIDARIKALEARLEQTAQRARDIPKLRALHERVTQTPLADVVDRLLEQGKEAELRDLVLALVASARLAERQPRYRSTWIRLEVTWTPDVQTLLDDGKLWLSPPPERPYHPTVKEQKHQNYLDRKARRLGVAVCP
jgi:DNA invertase Pin-like site-specific DNA recombinase